MSTKESSVTSNFLSIDDICDDVAFLETFSGKLPATCTSKHGKWVFDKCSYGPFTQALSCSVILKGIINAYLSGGEIQAHWIKGKTEWITFGN